MNEYALHGRGLWGTRLRRVARSEIESGNIIPRCLDASFFAPLSSSSITDIMASFSLPTIHDSPDGGWGPSTSNLPDNFKFKDIPYAPYSKTDKLGRFADWNDIAGDNRQGLNANANAMTQT